MPSVCFSSSIAGIVARLFVHPIDTIKARLQVAASSSSSSASSTSSFSRSLLGAAKQTVAEEGVFGLYRGFPAVVVGGTPIDLGSAIHGAPKGALPTSAVAA